MALKLKLRAGEKVVVNGAVIVNGDRPSTMTIKNFANILRESDVMQEVEAETPVKRTYYVAQLMLLDADNEALYRPQFDGLMADLNGVFVNSEVRELLQNCVDAANEKNYYKILAALRKVMKYETLLMHSTKMHDG